MPDLPVFQQPAFQKHMFPVLWLPVVGALDLESWVPDAVKNRTVGEIIIDLIAFHEESTIPSVAGSVAAGKFMGPAIYRDGSNPQGNFCGISYKMSGTIVHDLVIDPNPPEQRQIDIDLLFEVNLDPVFFKSPEKVTATVPVNKKIMAGTGLKETDQ